MEEQHQPINNQFSSSHMDQKKSNGVSKILVIIVGLIVLVLIGVSGFLLRGQFSQLTAQPSPSPIAETISEPSPSPSPEFDRSKYSIRVLNGTKSSGLAASVSAKLKELGYTADKTGNATSSAVARTTVRVKEQMDELLEQLIKDLAPDYDASAGASLKETDTVDAEVIIGAN